MDQPSPELGHRAPHQARPCIVIDPCSILVNRKAKQRKNDAIDARALLDLLVRHVTGDRQVSTVPVPPAEIDDQRELGRLLRKLGQTRRSLANRVRSVLWRYGIDQSYHTALPAEFAAMRTGDGQPLGVVTRMELETLCSQIEGLDRDLLRLENERVAQLRKPVTRAQEQARDLERLIGIGPIGAWTLAHEIFSWREFANGKKLGAWVGLAPTPWCSGTMQRDQGISKAGPRHLRSLMVQLAWLWIYHQPESALAKWYRERFGPTAKRSRRVGIIAVARKLLIALWKYTMTGIVPEGAELKSPSHRIDVPSQKGTAVRKLTQKPKTERVRGPRLKQAA
jgi:transposase